MISGRVLITLTVLAMGMETLLVAGAKNDSGSRTPFQPVLDESSIPHVGHCCSERSTAAYLWKCITRETKSSSENILSEYSERDEPIDLLVVTYATPNINDYAAYAIAVTAAWAEMQGYPFRVYTLEDEGDNGLELSRYDPRWNKVPIAKHALSEWFPTAKSVLWVDADLAAIDFGTIAADFWDQAPNASLYICAENEGSTTYTNSGSFLARNSPRAVELLSRWWSVTDRRTKSDQEAFDIMRPGHEHDIHIMHPSFFNTDPPAMTNMGDSDRAIHLMGSTTSYRARIFGKAFDEVCNARQEGRRLKHQLGITRGYLLSVAMEEHGREYRRLADELDQMDVDKTTLEDLKLTKSLEASALPLRHAMKHTGKEGDAAAIFTQVYGYYVKAFRAVRRRGISIPPDLIHDKLGFAMRYFNTVRDSDASRLIYAEALEDLDAIEAVISEKQLSTVYAMRSSLEEALAMHYIDREKWDIAAVVQRRAIHLLERQDIPDHVRIKPLGTLAGLLCRLGRRDEAKPHFEAIIQMLTEQYGDNHKTLAQHYFNRGICNFEASHYEAAKKDLDVAQQVYKSNGYALDSPEILRLSTFLKLVDNSLGKREKIKSATNITSDEL